LLPISQFAMMAGPIGYFDYEGFVPTKEDLARTAESFGGGKVVIMRRHGIMIWARAIPEAFWILFHLERAFEVQINAMSGGAQCTPASQDIIDSVHGQEFNQTHPDENRLMLASWDAAMRQMDRLDIGYRD
jgi:ribulose-5-phosphate 4-epimerase/fuculose-1-phosphate aldolase